MKKKISLFRIEKVIEVSDWDKLVMKTYGRPYSFQQQYGCQDRGLFRFNVPTEDDDFDCEFVSEIVNHNERGVSFSAWIKRDPKAPLADGSTDYSLDLWWHRNFYPHISMVINDLHAKGIIEAGNYAINIDW